MTHVPIATVKQFRQRWSSLDEDEHLVVGWHLHDIGELQSLPGGLRLNVRGVPDSPLPVHPPQTLVKLPVTLWLQDSVMFVRSIRYQLTSLPQQLS